MQAVQKNDARIWAKPQVLIILNCDHKKLKKLINKNTAAIMIETIIGEGGIKVIPNWCIKAIRNLCNQGILCT